MRSSESFSHAVIGHSACRASLVWMLLLAHCNPAAALAQEVPPAAHDPTPQENNATGGEASTEEAPPLQVFEPRGRITTEDAVFAIYYIGGCVAVGLILFLILFWKFYSPPSWMQSSRKSRRTVTHDSDAPSDESSSSGKPKGKKQSPPRNTDKIRYRI